MKLIDTVEYVPWKTLGAALVHAGLGEKDGSIPSTRESYRAASAFVILLKVDPRFDSLHSDLRFQHLLGRMNLAG